MISISSRPDRRHLAFAGLVQPRRFHGGSSDSTDLPGESFQGGRLETKAPVWNDAMRRDSRWKSIDGDTPKRLIDGGFRFVIMGDSKMDGLQGKVELKWISILGITWCRDSPSNTGIMRWNRDNGDELLTIWRGFHTCWYPQARWWVYFTENRI